ncbi:MAG: NUDIX domain-containing protein [Candidatus Competibacterales bacterium]|nr:NUDIX domain-containing protein [Candidatus Competibacterales bacterium]
MDYAYEVLERHTLCRSFLRLEAYRLRHRLFAGGWSAEMIRDCLERGQAVAVLPYDPVRDRVVLIEQFRVGALRAPVAHPWLLEIVAGEIGAGETPEQVARREAEEEAGCRLTTLEPICQYLVSPGSSAEWVHLFVGRIDSTGIGGLHGLDEEHEDIRVETVDREQALADLAEGRIVASPAIIALQWLALNGTALRRRWWPKG